MRRKLLEASCLELSSTLIYILLPLADFNPSTVINLYPLQFHSVYQKWGDLVYTISLQMLQIHIILFINEIIWCLRYMDGSIEEAELSMDWRPLYVQYSIKLKVVKILAILFRQTSLFWVIEIAFPSSPPPLGHLGPTAFSWIYR